MMSSANDLPKNDLPSPPGPDGNRGDGMEAPPTSNGEAPYFDSNGMSYRQYMNRPLTPELGPLGDNWEKAFTEKGEPYFIDKTTRTSSWLDPRLSQIQKQNLEDCADDELPFGWEKIDDPHYGSYYIDHVNRKTQYENPVLQAKRLKREREEAAATDRANMEYRSQPPAPAPYYCNTDPPKVNGDSQHQMIHQPESRMNSGRPFFTRDPNQLMGEIIHSSLLKGPRGLGFTIVGGDDHEEEFLQIKSVVPYGPAWEDGRLQTGDVLVYVNNICVLGFTHHDMVSMFQGISVGERVDLTVCRGYPLPFDPNDPNTEIVTTVAVSSNVDPQRNMPLSYDRRGDGPDGIESTAHSDDSLSRSAKSMPDLTNDAKDARSNDGRMRPGSADLLARNDPPSEVQVGPTPEHLIVPIVKGSQGFGFTIADAPYGQLKVKKIHDRMRCKNLMEGDILCEINNVDVRDTSRAEVVGLLSECPMEQEALILVFRSAYRFRKGDGDSGANSDSGIGRSSKPTNVFAMYRSKTPTADLYRTEPREIIPHRPKTPLLDTRQTRKNSDLNSPSKPYPGAFSYSSGFVPKPPPSEPEANRTGNVAFLAQQFSNTHISNRSVVPGASPSKEPAPETNAHSYAGSGGYGYDDENKQDDVRAANQLDYPSNDPYTRDFFQQDYYRSQGPQSPPDAYQQQQYMSQYGYYGPGDGEYQGENPYGGQNPNMPYNSLNRGGYPNHVDYAYGNGYPSRMGYMSPQARKESTSFEHEQPAPSPLVRIPKDLSRGRQVTFSNQARTNADYVDTVITLLRTDEGFGFRILGGAEEGSQVTIGQVLPGGAAAGDGRLRYGDELVAIDGHPVLGASHHHVISLMSAAGVNGRVSLTIRRPASGVNSRFSPEHGGQTSDNVYPYDITVNRRENEGFGFVIISSLAKAGSTIGRIIEGSPAERCGKLHIGDRILAVNGQSILHLPHGDIVSMIKDSGYSVTLRIGPPQDDNSSTASTSQRGESEGIEEEYYSVELARGDRGFGFSIRGGKEFQNMPLFVLRMAEGGPAAVDGRLNVGDQIMEINGVNTKDMAHADAIELIKAGPTVRLVVKRGVGMLPAALERAGSLAGSGIIGADSDEPPSPGPGTAHFGMSYNRPQKISPQHAYYYPPQSTNMNGPGMTAEYGGGPPNGQPNGPMMHHSSHVQPKPYNEIPVGNGGEAMMYNSYWDTYSVPASPSKR